jgi:hypothetical protein
MMMEIMEMVMLTTVSTETFIQIQQPLVVIYLAFQLQELHLLPVHLPVNHFILSLF